MWWLLCFTLEGPRLLGCFRRAARERTQSFLFLFLSNSTRLVVLHAYQVIITSFSFFFSVLLYLWIQISLCYFLNIVRKRILTRFPLLFLLIFFFSVFFLFPFSFLQSLRRIISFQVNLRVCVSVVQLLLSVVFVFPLSFSAYLRVTFVSAPSLLHE